MINSLSTKLRILALADAIIEPEWEYRYFSYNSNWSETEEMASLRDGCGGEWFLWLSGNLAGYKCLSPEDGLMPDLEGVKSRFPEEYGPFINEPAFSMDSATAIWYLKGNSWQRFGKHPEWLIDLEQASEWSHHDYHSWAIGYYEREIEKASLEKLFDGKFSEELAKNLNAEIDLKRLSEEAREIGTIT